MSKFKKISIAILFLLFISNFQVLYANEKIVYTNNHHGYKYNICPNCKVDDSKSEILTKIISDNYEIHFYYDNTANKMIGFSHFKRYANDALYKSEDYKVTSHYTSKVNGYNADIIVYSRRKLSKIPNDKNNYATITINKGKNEIITMMIKYIHPLDKQTINNFVSNLNFIKKSSNVPIFKGKSQRKSEISDSAKKFYIERLIKSPKQEFGVFEPKFGSPNNIDELNKLEEQMDYKFNLMLSYQTARIFSDENKDITKGLLQIRKSLLKFYEEDNRVPLFTISTHQENKDGSFSDKTLDILDGKYDYVLKEMAEILKSVEIPIMLRINNEMNGAWVTYCSHFQGKDPQIYIDCYKYIHNYFEKNGVNNVIYVFNPNNKSFPDFSFNSYLSYYPGDEYVDVIGLTAYNTGTYYNGEKWQSFEQLYDNLYNDYANRFSQPFIITEFSSSSTGGDKAMWFEDMMIKMKKYPKIKYAVLWNGTDFDMSNPNDIKISRDYRINYDEKVTEVLKKYLKNYK